jgi:hypothetical protein
MSKIDRPATLWSSVDRAGLGLAERANLTRLSPQTQERQDWLVELRSSRASAAREQERELQRERRRLARLRDQALTDGNELLAICTALQEAGDVRFLQLVARIQLLFEHSVENYDEFSDRLSKSYN